MMLDKFSNSFFFFFRLKRTSVKHTHMSNLFPLPLETLSAKDNSLKKMLPNLPHATVKQLL